MIFKSHMNHEAVVAVAQSRELAPAAQLATQIVVGAFTQAVAVGVC